MRRPFSERVERGRVTRGVGGLWSSRGDDYGMFDLVTNERAALRLMVSGGDLEIPWEHVSVSTRTRCPTWEELAWVKGLFFDDEDLVVQYFPRKSEHVNYHPFCLHLWRPTAADLPCPPPIAVGPRTRDELAAYARAFRVPMSRLRPPPGGSP